MILNRKFKFRCVLIEIVNYLPVIGVIVKTEDEETIYDFINTPYHIMNELLLTLKIIINALCINWDLKIIKIVYSICYKELIKMINVL